MPMPDAIDAFRQTLDHDTLAMIDALRGIVAGSHASLTERIKWNAPSFAVGDDDRITLGIERKGGVRIVLHRGAKPKDAAGFHFDDKAKLAKWPAPDRGVILFKDGAAIDAGRDALTDLCRRWIDATA